jgi:hypothetical protein
LRAEAKTITSAKSVSKLGSQVELGGLTEPLFHLSNENRSTWASKNMSWTLKTAGNSPIRWRKVELGRAVWPDEEKMAHFASWM